MTITRLARRFGLSRSTLLYYDRIGLLTPSARTRANYRSYTESDAGRLSQICRFRQAGLGLGDIRDILDRPASRLADVLEQRLAELNAEIGRLRQQQQFIVGILQTDTAHEKIGIMNKQMWVGLLQSAGFTEDDMVAWHLAFERTAPEKHKAFLEFLCIPENEIRRIREMGTGRESAGGAGKPGE